MTEAGTLDLNRSARLSECGRYRYSLGRTWDELRPRALFVMLNPSTADAEVDDATIRSCIRLCKSWDYGGLWVVNLFAWRATDPKELAQTADPVGPENDAAIADAAVCSDLTICAWGAHKMAKLRADKVLRIVTRGPDCGPVFAHCLGKTKSGAPKHPLYIKTGTTPELWP